MDRHTDRDGGLRLDDQLCFALYAATNATTRAYRPLLATLGLTYPQYLVMLALWQDGDATVGHLARRLRLDSHAVSPVVNRLEVHGHVVRRRGADRRQVVVAATAQGRELEAAASRAQAQVAHDTGLDPAELADLRGRLLELADHLTSHSTPDLRPVPHPAGRADTPRGEAS